MPDEKPAPRSPVDWEALYPASERGLESMCADLCCRPSLAEEMGWLPVAAIHRQLKLGNAIADIVVEHTDGSITVIEVKQPGLSLRDYCTGIGQLMYQSIMAASHFQTTNVSRVLATPGPISVDLIFACESAGIDLLPVSTIEQWRGFLREASYKAA